MSSGGHLRRLLLCGKPAVVDAYMLLWKCSSTPWFWHDKHTFIARTKEEAIGRSPEEESTCQKMSDCDEKVVNRSLAGIVSDLVDVFRRDKIRFTIRPETNSNDFRGFWNQSPNSNSSFVAAEIIFLNDSNFFGVFKVQSHTQCGRTCACAVACLCPRNSISNVVVSLTIHDDMHTHIYKECSRKHETIVEGQRLL